MNQRTVEPALTQAATTAVRAAVDTDPAHGAVMPPLYLSSNYSFEGIDQRRPYDYARSGNPNRDQLGHAIAELEGGVGSVMTSSGMAALHLICQLLAPEDLLIAPHDCYGGTFRLLQAMDEKGLFQVCFVDQNDERAMADAFSRGPRMVLLETPSNPLLRLVDIRAIARRAKARGALVAVDNTFLSPALQNPIRLGADIVVHSTTKYLNGHSDVVGGAVISANAKLHERLGWWANCLGLTGAPFDSYLTLRGLRTLYPRMRAHLENTQALVTQLCAHPAVRKVHYPGLPEHPGHALAKRQQQGFGAMISFELHGDISHVRAMVDALTLFTLAESLGGVESLISHPATMTHASMTAQAREQAGITDALVRISVGIEDSRDLLKDMAQALDAVPQACAVTPLSALAVC